MTFFCLGGLDAKDLLTMVNGSSRDAQMASKDLVEEVAAAAAAELKKRFPDVAKKCNII